MATSDSNGIIKICQIVNDQAHQQAAFQAHSGPCWQLSWAHPKFENVIATVGYDRYIKIWKEVNQGNWQIAFEVEAGASVNSVQWASWEYGLVLAAGSSDGKVHVLTRSDQDQWSQSSFVAHNSGVNGLSWGPATEPCLLMAENIDAQNPQMNNQALNLVPKRFVTGGMDGKVKIWIEREDSPSEFKLI